MMDPSPGVIVSDVLGRPTLLQEIEGKVYSLRVIMTSGAVYLVESMHTPTQAINDGVVYKAFSPRSGELVFLNSRHIEMWEYVVLEESL